MNTLTVRELAITASHLYIKGVKNRLDTHLVGLGLQLGLGLNYT